MNRSESELEALVNALSAHYGDDSFAIVNDVVRSAPTLSVAEISATVAGIFGSEPVVLQLPSAPAAEEPELPSQDSELPIPRIDARPPHSKRPHAPPKPSKDRYAPVNPFEALEEGKLIRQQTAPMKSIWETVLSENRASTRPENIDQLEDNDFTLEEHDSNALEDVDPVALAMAENPDFFKPVPTTAEIEASLGLSDAPSSNNASVPAASDAPKAAPTSEAPADVSRLVSHSFFLGGVEDADKSPSTHAQSGALPIKAPTAEPQSAPGNQPAPGSQAFPAPNRTVIDASDLFARHTPAANDEASIDFWLPQPPATEEEARSIYNRLSMAATDSSEGWREKQWSASGDFAIAPSPASIMRMSLNEQPSGPEFSAPSTPAEDFKLDEEALNFLGELFPDFEPSYLADCLRGANNSVATVAEFLLPVEMESIDFGDEEDLSSWFAPGEADHDPDALHPYPMGDDAHPDASAAPQDVEVIEIADDDLPEQDAQFNENYHKLVEIYPWVDRDWILQALLDTDDLEKAADILMRSVAEDRPVLPEDSDAPQDPQSRRGRRGARRGRNAGAGRRVPVNAWDHRFNPADNKASFAGYPSLSGDNFEHYDGRNGPIVIRSDISAVNPRAPAQSRIYNYGSIKPRSSHYANAAATGARAPAPGAIQYVETNLRPHVGTSDSRAPGHWAELMQQANAMFEASGTNKRAAVAAFSRQHGVAGIMAQLREENNNWQRLVQQAGKEFYEDGMKVVDLHGLRLKPASQFVAAILQAHWETGQHYRLLDIITGRGSHSVDGIARIKEDVRRQLKNYNVQWLNEGCVRVLLPKPDYH